ncbi:MAG: 50S ribosomal protein L15 [Patescibacteria group bacterium]
MAIRNLSYKTGSIKKSKPRVGRGIGSRLGVTCGKGPEGQTKRAGGSVGNVFQGGQTVLVKCLPLLRGTRNVKKSIKNLLVNFSNFPVGVTEVDARTLVKFFPGKKVKVLGNGEISSKVKVLAHEFSKTAKEKIEKAGGEAVIIQ